MGLKVPCRLVYTVPVLGPLVRTTNLAVQKVPWVRSPIFVVVVKKRQRLYVVNTALVLLLI